MARFDDITFKEAFRYWPLILIVVSLSFRFTQRVGNLERRSEKIESAQAELAKSMDRMVDRIDDVIWLSRKQVKILKSKEDNAVTLTPDQIRILRRYGERE